MPDTESGPSLFEQLCGEAVGPCTIELPDPGDPGHVLDWTIHQPDADGVCELDDLTQASDIIDALVGDDDLADELLDDLEPLPWSETLRVCTQLRLHFALVDLPRGLWTHLVERIDCYGEAAEADLADRGIDLLDFFRGVRPWPQLARLLARLPAGSRYVAAILDDEDLARERIEAGEDPPPARTTPPLEGETQDRALLRAVVSALMRVEHAQYAVHAKKGQAGRPPRPLPGPETAEDRLREDFADRDVEDIFDQVAPWWRGHDENDTQESPAGFARSASGLYVPD